MGRAGEQDRSLTRVLVADDSPLFCETMVALLGQDPDLCVVGVARDGEEAVAMTAKLRPDIITMDVQMPVMGGLEAIEKIMSSRPTPILVVTSQACDPGSELAFEAIRLGALDVVAKPLGAWSSDTQRSKLIAHIKMLAGVSVVYHAPCGHRPALREPQRRPDGIARRAAEMIGIVASTGGPAALARLLGSLPEGFPVGIAVVQHLAAGFVGSLAWWLRRDSALEVRVAERGDCLTGGTVLLAPDNCNLVLTRSGRVELEVAQAVSSHCPSGDLLLDSIAANFGHRGIGIVLTGMGSDGVEGLLAIREAGGVAIAQSETDCAIYGMPKAARARNAAEFVLDLDEIGPTLCGWVEMDHPVCR